LALEAQKYCKYRKRYSQTPDVANALGYSWATLSPEVNGRPEEQEPKD
jgi:hypothetical protein